MTKIIILSGISGAGKSTWTQNHIKLNSNFVSISRDKLRELLFGYNESNVEEHYASLNFKEREKLISTFQITNIRQAIAQGFDIVIDNTHLDRKYIDDMVKEFPQCDFDFVLIDTDSNTAIERDRLRLRKVGKDVIQKQFNQLQKLKQNFDFKPIFSNFVKVTYDVNLPDCIICDLDGTIADYSGTRPAYGFDPNLIRLDKVIEPVLSIVQAFGQNHMSNRIIFLSGRTDEYFTETMKWLYDNTCLYKFQYSLFMRKSNDFRKDSIINKEIFEANIRNKYNVKFAIDDRKSIVNLWQSLGIFVLNVNQNCKEF
jgi:predicted kinase